MGLPLSLLQPDSEAWTSPDGVGIAIAVALVPFSLWFFWRMARQEPPPTEGIGWHPLDAIAALLFWLGASILAVIFAAFTRAVILERLGVPDPFLGPALRALSVLELGFTGAFLSVAAGLLLLLAAPRVRDLDPFRLGRAHLSEAGRGLLACVVVLPAIFAATVGWGELLVALGYEPRPQLLLVRFQDGLAQGWYAESLLIVASGVLAAPVVEEVVFRGFIYRWAEERWGVGVGVLVSSVVFGGVHGYLLAFLPVTLLGAVLALTYRRSGSLWSAVALHSLFNLASLFFVFLEGI